MKVPKDFKARIAGNFYQNTPNLVVCFDEPILRVERDAVTGELLVDLAIFDSSGNEMARVEGAAITRGNKEDYTVKMTDQNFTVREIGTGRTVCRLQRCASTRNMDVDVYVLTHAPDGFFIHANPLQSNIGNKATGDTFSNLEGALVMNKPMIRRR